MKFNIQQLTFEAVSSAVSAGIRIIEIYEGNFSVELKADASPLTAADLAAHSIIENKLKPLGIPILSEEGCHQPYEVRSKWEYFWLIDPLDGTREFIKHNGEFTVNIALIHNQQPIAGVIYVPVTGALYFSTIQSGAFRTIITKDINLDKISSLHHIQKISVKLPEIMVNNGFSILVSRSHLSGETADIIKKIEGRISNVKIVSAGSSLKFCHLAEGSAQFYPRLGPTMEWDTAAGHAIARAAGITVITWPDKKPMIYNKPDLRNSWFIAGCEPLPDFI